MKTRRHSAAFTLLELLVVIGLMAGLSFFLIGGLAGGGRSAALQSGQATVINLLMVARTHAMASGNHTRVLVNHERLAAERYLRQLVLQESRNGNWHTLQLVALPAGVHVVPHQDQMPDDLFGAGAPWVKADGSRLHSSCLSRVPVSLAVDTAMAEMWVELVFTPLGTTGTSGFLVLATGRTQPPGSAAATQSPIWLENQMAVRGLQLSAYGLSLPINERDGF